MENDPFPNFEFLTLTQLGQMFGVSGHTVGRWLEILGLRFGKTPTEKARTAGVAKLFRPDHGGNAFWTWEKDRLVRALVAAGRERDGGTAPPAETLAAIRPSPNRVGPFTARPSSPDGGDGYEIRNGDGVTVVWTRQGFNAKRLTALMNLAHQHGKL